MQKRAPTLANILVIALFALSCFGLLLFLWQSFGGPVPLAQVTLVYLTGVTVSSVIPTPGGLGTVEAVLTAGLTAAGVPSAAAVSAVLLFRLLTFWLPVPFGWAALSYLERKQAL